MLVLELTFSAGRYHATPWGRHVNEGAVEWPASPYRLIRALFDTWKRKRPEWDAARVERVLFALASAPPRFRLPQASTSHTRSFLSTNTRDVSDRTLIFDAFAAVSPRSPVMVGWPDVTLDRATESDLDELLEQLNFLGRSESWVSARVLAGVQSVEWNCTPGTDNAESGDSVPIACAIPRNQWRGSSPWLDALAFSTTSLLKTRLSGPPAMQYIDYVRPPDCFSVSHKAVSRAERPIHGVLYALDSKVLPLATSTLEIAERVRTKLMGIHKALAGGPELVSSRFSGKDAEGKPLKGHRHVFVLPSDENHDGRLDHLLVVCRDPLDRVERLALDRLQSLWQSDGRPDIRCIPVRWGALEQLLRQATHLSSVTPFVPARHYRKGRGTWPDWVAQQLVRECRQHGLPEPIRVTLLGRHLLRGGRSYRWLEFRRNRKDDEVRTGYGFEVEFDQPVLAPLALGYGCHFGLGQFQAAVDKERERFGEHESRHTARGSATYSQ
jgi:CRISPR-associated protein Csb2